MPGTCEEKGSPVSSWMGKAIHVRPEGDGLARGSALDVADHRRIQKPPGLEPQAGEDPFNQGGSLKFLVSVLWMAVNLPPQALDPGKIRLGFC